MNNNLLILCDSAYGIVAKVIAFSMGCFEIIDMLDQHTSASKSVEGYHEVCIGKVEDYEDFANTYSYAVVAFEDSHARLAWSDKLIEVGFTIATLVSPQAYVSPSAQINQGCIIEPLVGIQSNALIGACTMIKMGALIDHNSAVAEGCCCENYSLIKTGAFIEPHRVVDVRRTVEGYEEAQKIRESYN